ncbi:uncharacterized protein AB675_10467 [Cyphellophora attinorum]|uniref:Uncharacterized protein n=1 Tax=Cyphellophora attinorum TaxID=1664694 RepID=A0A0N1H395_9EURO|nr:uncharacterized protein AB675_10467 [Phialophora attinorum]KPI35966.1 hypothetical protein AB675_10467 [Phialophora attinorum]
MSPSEATIPSDDEIVSAVEAAKHSNPSASRNDIFALVKTLNSWTISNKQIKKAVDPKPPPPPTIIGPALPPITLPKDALAAQQAYKDTSTRLFRLYGRGEHDYGCSPNSDQQIRIDIMHKRLLDVGCPGPFHDDDKEIVGSAMPLQEMLKFYYAAGKQVGLTKEDVARQLEAEYGVNPLPYEVVESEETRKERQEVYAKNLGEGKKKILLRAPEARKYIQLDAKGEPVFDEKVHGEFTVLVVKIKKGDGLTEFGRV